MENRKIRNLIDKLDYFLDDAEELIFDGLHIGFWIEQFHLLEGDDEKIKNQINGFVQLLRQTKKYPKFEMSDFRRARNFFVHINPKIKIKLDRYSANPELYWLKYFRKRRYKSFYAFVKGSSIAKEITDLVGKDWLSFGFSIERIAFYSRLMQVVLEEEQEGREYWELKKKEQLELEQEKKQEEIEINKLRDCKQNIEKYEQHREEIRKTLHFSTLNIFDIEAKLTKEFDLFFGNTNFLVFLDTWFESSSNNIKIQTHSTTEQILGFTIELGYARKKTIIDGVFILIKALNDWFETRIKKLSIGNLGSEGFSKWDMKGYERIRIYEPFPRQSMFF